MGNWLTNNWFEVFSSGGIVASLLFTAVSLRSETKTRKIANLLAMTANHRDVWKELFRSDRLGRVLDKSANILKQPVTLEEERFVNMVILHLGSMFEALQDGLIAKQEGLTRDIKAFFSLPVPLAVWSKTRAFQNGDFVDYVEKCQRG